MKIFKFLILFFMSSFACAQVNEKINPIKEEECYSASSPYAFEDCLAKVIKNIDAQNMNYIARLKKSNFYGFNISDVDSEQNKNSIIDQAFGDWKLFLINICTSREWYQDQNSDGDLFCTLRLTKLFSKDLNNLEVHLKNNSNQNKEETSKNTKKKEFSIETYKRANKSLNLIFELIRLSYFVPKDKYLTPNSFIKEHEIINYAESSLTGYINLYCIIYATETNENFYINSDFNEPSYASCKTNLINEYLDQVKSLRLGELTKLHKYIYRKPKWYSN
ncbi:hypothetical protein [Taylorella equigenitalis]|uniref:Lipoprotein n=3 Tax=Taylorella equigenitalis TaxID=29575 RepID=A0A654KJB1_TAYEM|nr:hypothetical protein [Taylorella equigenitalis]ADU92495.1 hypothetical protein TEQUI_1583 [Taylorella equigenitalis MCE9]AFN36043.1 putative lipoprotein [Taylorella equigenitalis ATCC 35865]ASY39457.1 hypothetical protein CA604_04885 [Taylorella equigenitalis]WDU55781.1 hypothetical protein KPH58_04700 [Taylorella equigenitalis]VEG31638.1 Uncharacterised protein [Taylorella equigenitalis ATCC 35865]